MAVKHQNIKARSCDLAFILSNPKVTTARISIVEVILEQDKTYKNKYSLEAIQKKWYLGMLARLC